MLQKAYNKNLKNFYALFFINNFLYLFQWLLFFSFYSNITTIGNPKVGLKVPLGATEI